MIPAAAFVGERQARSALGWVLNVSVSSFWSGPMLAPELSGNVRLATMARRLTGVIRDVFGDPFGPVQLNPAWRTPEVLTLARGIYESADWQRLPILADALEEAGCDEAAVLSHCRAEAEHVRGCWVIEAVTRAQGAR